MRDTANEPPKDVPHTSETPGGEIPAKQIPEEILWRVIFSFPSKLEKAAEQARADGKPDSLQTGYFTRQAKLSAADAEQLKNCAAGFEAEIQPVNEQIKNTVEQFQKRADKSRSNAPNAEILQLQKQKNEITLRYRDNFRNAVGEESFAAFEKWLTEEFSKGFNIQPLPADGKTKTDRDEFKPFDEVPMRNIKIAGGKNQ